MRDRARRSQPAQVEDRIADQLARPVIGHVTTAPTVADLHPAPLELPPVDEQVPRIAASPQRDHRRVFQQQQRVRDHARAPGVDEGILELMTVVDLFN